MIITLFMITHFYYMSIVYHKKYFISFKDPIKTLMKSIFSLLN